MPRASLVLVCGLLLLLYLPSRGETAIRALLERPFDRQIVAGVGVIGGWAFSETPGVRITQVTLKVDGDAVTTIPCCSERNDVQTGFPEFPADNTLNSGFGITWNYNLGDPGPHTIGVAIEDSSGAHWETTYSVVFVKPHESEFLDLFDFANATARLDGEEIVVSSVRARDKASQQRRQIDVRLRWFNNLQGLGIVNSAPSGAASAMTEVQPITLIRPTATSSLRGSLESPSNGSPVAGIGVVRGWVFPIQGRSLRSVRLLVDGAPGPTIPCCSPRSDVQDVYPQESNALLSGFGVTVNYGNLEKGPHTIEVQIEDSAGALLSFVSQVTVVRPANFVFLDRFDLSAATLTIADKDLIVSTVQVRDQATQQTLPRILRFRWDINTQGFLLVKDTEDPTLLFSDDFSEGQAGGWDIASGQWAVVDGEFIDTADNALPSVTFHEPVSSDVQLTAQARSTDDDDFGLIVRARDRDNFYFFTVNAENSRAQFQKRVRGETHLLGESSFPPPPSNIPFEISVRAQQNHLQAFINGRLILAIEDAEFSSGRSGLYARHNKRAAFDRVRLVTTASLKSIGGNIIYVDAANKGKKADGQTPATAWGAIKDGLQDPRFQDSAGNTILLMSGVYFEQIDIVGKMSGIPGAFNTLRAAEGADVIIDGEKDTPNGRPEAVLIHTGVSYVRVEGLQMRNTQHRGILVFDSGPGELIRNRIQHCGDSGIDFWYGARHYDVVNNVIFHNEADGIGLSQGSGEDSTRFAANHAIRIRNNLIVANGGPGENGNGVMVQGDQPHTFALYNNTIIANSGNGIVTAPGVGHGDIRNNIVATNGRIGLKNGGDDAVARDFNNLFANGATGENNFDGAGGPGKNSLSADPLFVNEANGDFRLQTGSPSLDSGDSAAQFNDPDGSRNDMGAYGGPNALVGALAF